MRARLAVRMIGSSAKGGEDMTTMVRWSPLRDLDAIERRFQRLLGDSAWTAPGVLPATDVYETDGEYIVELEVPGFEQRELGIEVTGHLLTVTGERKEEKETQEKAFRLHERLEDRFERRFELPREADTEHVRATFEKGVLTVHAPKAARPRAKKIAISKA
jgi:HSP20 family protein